MPAPAIRFSVWPKLNATLKPECLFCVNKATQQATGSLPNTVAQMRCCTNMRCMEQAYRMAIISLGVSASMDITEAVAWVEEHCKRSKIAWKNLTPEARGDIMALVPCHVRCWRSGGPVSVGQGETCPHCGREETIKSAWDHLKNPLV